MRLKGALRAGKFCWSDNPLSLAGSAYKNKGVQELLDAVIDFLPSPLDVPEIDGVTLRVMRLSVMTLFSALMFKIMIDPYVGKLTYIRAYLSRLRSCNSSRTTAFGQYSPMNAKRSKLS